MTRKSLTTEKNVEAEYKVDETALWVQKGFQKTCDLK